MATIIDEIEEAIKDLLAGIRAGSPPARLFRFREVTSYEASLQPRPQAQLYFAGAGQRPLDTMTSEVNWRFVLDLYFQFSEKRGYQQFKDFYAQWPKLVRNNQELGGLVESWDWEELGPPEFDFENQWVWAQLLISTFAEEGD